MFHCKLDVNKQVFIYIIIVGQQFEYSNVRGMIITNHCTNIKTAFCRNIRQFHSLPILQW